MRRKLIVVFGLVLLTLCSGVVFLMISTREPVPPWQPGSRSDLREFIDRLFGAATARLQAEFITVAASLRNIASAQAQFQACAFVDEDFDGTGEYGTFAELSAAMPVRGSDRILNPPVLSAAWKRINGGGYVFREGYEYQMLLPGPEGGALAEVAGEGFPAGATDPELAENGWACVARPIRMTRTTEWSYVVTESGDLWGKHGRVEFAGAVQFDAKEGRTMPAGDGWLPVE